MDFGQRLEQSPQAEPHRDHHDRKSEADPQYVHERPPVAEVRTRSRHHDVVWSGRDRGGNREREHGRDEFRQHEKSDTPCKDDKNPAGGVHQRGFDSYSGDDPLSHGKDRSTIGAGGLNCRVRDGNGCGPAAIATGNIKKFPTIKSRVWRHLALDREPMSEISNRSSLTAN